MSPVLKTLPVELLLEGRPCAVIGADRFVEPKVERLIHAGADVTWFTCGTSRRRSDCRVVTDLPDDLEAFERYAVIFVSPELESMAEALLDKHPARLVCALDRPESSTFVNPAVVETAAFALRLFSRGASPGLTRRLREDLEAAFGHPDFIKFVDVLKDKRANLDRGERAAQMGRAVADFSLRVQWKFPSWF